MTFESASGTPSSAPAEALSTNVCQILTFLTRAKLSQPIPTITATSSTITPVATSTVDSIITPATTLQIQPSSSSVTADAASTSSSSTINGNSTDTAAAAAAAASTSSSSAANGNSTDAAAAAAADTSSFTLPGKKLSVLPIGLGVFAGISVIALIVVGLVTYERTKYRKVSNCSSIDFISLIISLRRSDNGNLQSRVLQWVMAAWRRSCI